MTAYLYRAVPTRSRYAPRVAEMVRGAGQAGLSVAALAAGLGIGSSSIDSILATATRAYPEMAEDDGGRLVWVTLEGET